MRYFLILFLVSVCLTFALIRGLRSLVNLFANQIFDETDQLDHLPQPKADNEPSR